MTIEFRGTNPDNTEHFSAAQLRAARTASLRAAYFEREGRADPMEGADYVPEEPTVRAAEMPSEFELSLTEASWNMAKKLVADRRKARLDSLAREDHDRVAEAERRGRELDAAISEIDAADAKAAEARLSRIPGTTSPEMFYRPKNL
jgi:hypothetical protein